ncbi:MAG: copper amine oxidase N-terminal domain-containing protein [Bacillota bacterium]
MTALIKRRIGLLVFAMLFVFTSTIQAAPAKTPAQIRVFLDGQEIKFQAAPVIKNGVTFVQFRPLFQTLGYKVNWTSATKQVTGTLADQKLVMKLGSTIAYVNGQKTKLPIAPYTKAGNTLVPLRFVAESTGLPVKWDAKARTIKIDRKTVTDKASTEIKKLYKNQAAAESKGDLKGAMTAIHPKSPSYKEYEQSYKEMAGYNVKVSSFAYDVTVAGSSVVASVEKTYERTSGPFIWDFTIYYDVILKKNASGAWKEYDSALLDIEYHVPDGFLEQKPVVPEAEQTAMLNTLQTHYKGMNEEDRVTLLSAVYPKSPYFEMMNEAINAGIFDDLNFHIQADASHIVLYQDNEAVIYTEETDDADGDTYTSSSLYWLKKNNGHWLIYDLIDITE